jgi:hypothetical protein
MSEPELPGARIPTEEELPAGEMHVQEEEEQEEEMPEPEMAEHERTAEAEEHFPENEEAG